MTNPLFKPTRSIRGYKEVAKPTSTFKSEIDWRAWNDEIPDNKELMQEYNVIEQQAKADGSWMKNESLFKDEIANAQKEYDNLAQRYSKLKKGSEWISSEYRPQQLKNIEELEKLKPTIGDIHDKLSFYKTVKFTPEQFVQIRSRNFKKAFPDGFDRIYRGVQKFNADNITEGSYRNIEDGNILFGVDKLGHSQAYAKNGASGRNLDHYFDAITQPEFLNKNSKIPKEAIQIADDELLNPGVLDLVYSKNINKKIIDAKGKRWNELELHGSTDDIARKMKSLEIESPVVEIKNIHDGGDYFGNYKESNISLINPSMVPMKSLRYNNGVFDMTNPNIYKALMPVGIGGTMYKKIQNYSKK